MLEPVAIGRLERFVGDMAINAGWANVPYIEPCGFRIGIVGAGPAGLTAGIYLARNRLKPLIVDTGTVGGQMVLSYEVSNYPGVEAASGRAISQTRLLKVVGLGGFHIMPSLYCLHP